jgi:hypothetical protein
MVEWLALLARVRQVPGLNLARPPLGLSWFVSVASGACHGSRVQLKCDGAQWRAGGEVKEKLANGVGSQYSSHYLWTSSITTADAHTSAASSRLNLRPRLFKWTRLFRRKTKSGFCACVITFQTHSTTEFHFRFRTHLLILLFSILPGGRLTVCSPSYWLRRFIKHEYIKWARKVSWKSTISCLCFSELCNNTFFSALHGTSKPARKRET